MKTMVLKINYDLLIKDLSEDLCKAVDHIMNDFVLDSSNGMNSNEKSDIEIDKAITDGKMWIKSRVIFGAFAIMRSFGTGSLMDRDVESFKKYISQVTINGVPYFNIARIQNDFAITGRAEGEYIDIFGEAQYSAGRLEGFNLEKLSGGFIKPIKPTYGIQEAELWLKNKNGKLDRQLTISVKKFFNQNSSKYFYNTFV